MLGAGYDEQFSAYDAEGQAHRLYPNKFRSTKIDRYDVQFVQIDDALKLKAAANFLFASAGVQTSTTKRYVWMQVYHLTKVVSLVRRGKPRDQARLVAEKLYYGNAFNVIISGEGSRFTTDVAAKLRSGGGNLSTFARKHRLEIKFVTDGLRLKKGAHVPMGQDPSKVRAAFMEGRPQPIFVEFMPMKQMFTKPIAWSTAKLTPGKYKLTRVTFDVARTKSSGRPWDAFGGAPDPLIVVAIGRAEPTTLCFAKNAYDGKCHPEKVFDLKEGVRLTFAAIDKDVRDNDTIGETVPFDLLKSGTPFRSIPVKTTGQLRSLKIMVEPVR